MAKRGRPPVEDPRKHPFRLRMNDEEKALLDEAAERTGWTTSEIIREGVRRVAKDAEETEDRILRAFGVGSEDCDESCGGDED